MSDLLKGMRPVRAAEEDEVYCAAYGSNLNEERMLGRCPGAEVFGTSMITGYRLLFKQSRTGSYATIEQDANCRVPVVIYKMTPEDEASLDRHEGCPRYYYKREFLLPVWGTNGRKKRNRRNCIAYVLHEHRMLGYPTAGYYRLLDEGYERWGFDKAWLRKALSDSMGEKLAAGWLKQYKQEEKNGCEKILHGIRQQPVRGADEGEMP